MRYGQVIFVSICFIALFGHSCHSQEKTILDRWQTNAAPFTIRVTEFQEKRFPLSKFSYVFEAKPSGSNEWSEIMIAITDNDIAIPREQVRFISDRTAYLFMMDKYAITKDGGYSWSIWKANDRIAVRDYPDQFFIKDVLVNHDGSGTLIVASRSADRQTLQFWTEDFGHSWAAK